MAGIKEPRAIAAKPPDDPIKKAYHYIITCLILHIFAIVSTNFPSPPQPGTSCLSKNLDNIDTWYHLTISENDTNCKVKNDL
jgi:hypothetical protein